MGVLYARVAGAWVPVIAPPPAVTVPDEVWIGPNSPVDATSELWVDTDDKALYAKISGSWTKVTADQAVVPDEVWIGATDPTSTTPSIELWFDSDDEPAAADNANYWNSSWGIVAQATVPGTLSATANVTLAVSAQMTFRPLVGRRYLARASVRAVVPTSTGNSYLMLYRDGGQWTDTHTYAGGANINLRLDAVFDGDGVQHTYQAYWQPSISATVYSDAPSSYLYIEDVGPVTRAAVNPPAGQPQVAAAGNSLGVVAVGAMKGGSPTSIAPSTYGNITNDLPVFLALGRRYKIAFAVRALGLSSITGGFNYRLSLNPSTPFGERLAWCGGQWSIATDHWIVDGDGAQHTLNVVMYSGAGTLSVFTESNSHFYVEDVGPNQAPALPIPETPPAWTPLTYQGTWSTWDVSRSPASYRKIGDMVQLRLQGKPGTQGTVIAYLPVGFRPPAILDFIGRDSNGPGIFNINGDGGIVWYGTTASWVVLNCQFSVTA